MSLMCNTLTYLLMLTLICLLSSYVVNALQLNTELPFEMERLQELVKMDFGSRKRHKEWIATAVKEGRGVRTAVPQS